MPSDYETVWSDLNQQLHAIEMGSGGLSGALADLEAHQRGTGFIKDDLREVERHTFREADNRGHFFRVQFNPKRLLRFQGAGKPLPQGTPLKNGGCFLCRDNIRWLQDGVEYGYEMHINGSDYNVWMNPFPLQPGHVVVAAKRHVSQDWALTDGGTGIERILADLVTLVGRSPGYVGFYNGVSAGASIPGHLHFQMFRRPRDEPEFPLEVWVARASPNASSPSVIEDYPVPVVVWQGKSEDIAKDATAWIRDWGRRNRDRMDHMSGNIIATAGEGPGTASLYFVPRDRNRPRWGEEGDVGGLAGGLEVLGEVVFSTEAEAALLANGTVDYAFLKEALGHVRTPLEA